MEHTDNINHPKHYASHANRECIDIAQYFPFSLGCAYKHVWRAGEKEEQGKSIKEKEAEDAEKALWYLIQWDEFHYPLPRPTSDIFNDEKLHELEQTFTGYKQDILKQFHLLLKEILADKPSGDAIDRITYEIALLLKSYIFSSKAWVRSYKLTDSLQGIDRDLLAEYFHDGAMYAYDTLTKNEK